MEFLGDIWRYIVNERKIAREDKERKKRKNSLKDYFNSDAGKKHLEGILKDLNIEDASRTRVVTIDNDLRDFRLSVNVDEDIFRNILRSKRPPRIKYQVTNRNDVMDAGNLLLELDDRVVIQTSGIIFPQAGGIKGILSELPEVQYVPSGTETQGSFSWRELALKEAQ